jgi:hypothetical protein
MNIIYFEGSANLFAFETIQNNERLNINEKEDCKMHMVQMESMVIMWK